MAQNPSGSNIPGSDTPPGFAPIERPQLPETTHDSSDAATFTAPEMEPLMTEQERLQRQSDTMHYQAEDISLALQQGKLDDVAKLTGSLQSLINYSTDFSPQMANEFLKWNYRGREFTPDQLRDVSLKQQFLDTYNKLTEKNDDGSFKYPTIAEHLSSSNARFAAWAPDINTVAQYDNQMKQLDTSNPVMEAFPMNIVRSFAAGTVGIGEDAMKGMAVIDKDDTGNQVAAWDKIRRDVEPADATRRIIDGIQAGDPGKAFSSAATKAIEGLPLLMGGAELGMMKVFGAQAMVNTAYEDYVVQGRQDVGAAWDTAQATALSALMGNKAFGEGSQNMLKEALAKGGWNRIGGVISSAAIMTGLLTAGNEAERGLSYALNPNRKPVTESDVNEESQNILESGLENASMIGAFHGLSLTISPHKAAIALSAEKAEEYGRHADAYRKGVELAQNTGNVTPAEREELIRKEYSANDLSTDMSLPATEILHQAENEAKGDPTKLKQLVDELGQKIGVKGDDIRTKAQKNERLTIDAPKAISNAHDDPIFSKVNAKEMGFGDKDLTANDVATSVDAANTAFQNYVKNEQEKLQKTNKEDEPDEFQKIKKTLVAAGYSSRTAHESLIPLRAHIQRAAKDTGRSEKQMWKDFNLELRIHKKTGEVTIKSKKNGIENIISSNDERFNPDAAKAKARKDKIEAAKKEVKTEEESLKKLAAGAPEVKEDDRQARLEALEEKRRSLNSMIRNDEAIARRLEKKAAPSDQEAFDKMSEKEKEAYFRKQEFQQAHEEQGETAFDFISKNLKKKGLTLDQELSDEASEFHENLKNSKNPSTGKNENRGVGIKKEGGLTWDRWGELLKEHGFIGEGASESDVISFMHDAMFGGHHRYAEHTGELGQDNRGGFFVDKAGRRVIELYKTADRSTFLHESFHAIKDFMKQLVDSGADKTGRIAENLKVLDEFNKGDEEKSAKAYERWIAEGKAPKAGLLAAFEHIKEWMFDIYHHLGAIDAPITDDVRNVFERMMADDEERAEAKQAYAIMDAHIKSDVLREAQEKLPDPSEQAGVYLKTWLSIGKNEGLLKDSVAKEVADHPVYKAINTAKSKGGINKESLIERGVSEKIIARINKRHGDVIKEGGKLSIESLTTEGDNPDELIKKMSEAKKEQEVAKSLLHVRIAQMGQSFDMMLHADKEGRMDAITYSPESQAYLETRQHIIEGEWAKSVEEANQKRAVSDAKKEGKKKKQQREEYEGKK